MKLKNRFKYALTLFMVGAFFINLHAAETSTSTASVASSSSSSSSSGKSSIGVGMGQTFLFGDFRETGDDSITFDLLYSYNASRTFDLLLTGHYTQHELRGKQTQLLGFSSSIKSRVFNFDSFSPYVLGGLGFYRPKVTRQVGVNNFQESEGKYTFGFNFGAGVDLELNDSYTIGLMASYHNPFKVKQDRMGSVRGSYSKLLVTLMRAF